MDKPFIPWSPPRSRARAAAVGAVLAAAGLTLAACSSAAQPAASGTALAPGAGQVSLAGMPGATGTGAAQAPGTASASGSMPGMTMPMTGSAQPAAGAPVATDTVAIKNFAFAPAAITVKVGTKVTWTNQDTDAHTVTSQTGGGPLNSQPLNTGQSYSYTFTKAGTFSYLCTIHPFMTATVTVTP